MNNLKITTSELAKICKVSQGTVDRALNNRPGISKATKEQILKAAEAYGYRRDSENGRELLKTIGIIVFNLNNDYFSKLICETESVCRKIGYSATVMFTDYDKKRETEALRRMYNIGAEGVILCPVNSGEEFVNYIKSLNMPVITVGNNTDGVPYAGIDDFAAMKELCIKILKKPYKNIIYFSPAIQYDDAYAQKCRFEGFLSAVGNRPYSVITDIEKIKKEYDKETVIICSTDYYALKVYFATKNVTITGFDNIEILDKYKIPITSVGFDMPTLAKAAVDMIINNNCRDYKLDYSIFEREC